MNRIDRVTAILIQLQSKRVVKAQELAERFGISLRTIYRDIRTLEEAGVPIIGEAGVGYSIMEGYRLPPVMFTREEASAFLVAEKLVENYTDQASSRIYKEAMFKIKAVLRLAEQDFLETVDEQIIVMKSDNKAGSKRDDQSFQRILSGISEKRVITMAYQASYATEVTERDIEPIGIFLQNTYWYLIAYCRLKKDYRNFRVDRIVRLETTTELFTTQHPKLSAYLNRLPDKTALESVVIRIDRSIAKYIVTEKYYHGFLTETEIEDQIEMHFLTASLEGFARWYLMLGSNATIVLPGELKERVREILKEIAGNL